MFHKTTYSIDCMLKHNTAIWTPKMIFLFPYSVSCHRVNKILINVTQQSIEVSLTIIGTIYWQVIRWCLRLRGHKNHPLQVLHWKSNTWGTKFDRGCNSNKVWIAFPSHLVPWHTISLGSCWYRPITLCWSNRPVLTNNSNSRSVKDLTSSCVPWQLLSMWPCMCCAMSLESTKAMLHGWQNNCLELEDLHSFSFGVLGLRWAKSGLVSR